MLVVRQEQLDAIAASGWDACFKRTLRRVRTTRPDRTSGRSDVDLRRLYDSSATRAREFGLVTEWQIQFMFEASIVLGDRFEKSEANSWTLEVLQSRHLSSDDRAALLLAHVDYLTRPGAASESADDTS